MENTELKAVPENDTEQFETREEAWKQAEAHEKENEKSVPHHDLVLTPEKYWCRGCKKEWAWKKE